MKNKFLAFGAAALLLASCSSDDDGPSIDYNQLTKKWYFVSERVNGQTYEYDDHEPCGKDYIEFQSDNFVNVVDVWDCDGNTPITDESTYVYARDGKTITIVTMAGQQQATIQKLTSSTLEIKSVYDYDDDGDEETVIEKYTSNPN